MPSHILQQAASGDLQTHAWLLIAFPLFGATILLLGGRATDKWGHWLGLAASAASFVYAVPLFFNLAGLDAADRSRDLYLFSWIPVGGLHVDAGLLVDPLSMAFVLTNLSQIAARGRQGASLC